METILEITGMTCTACVGHVEKALEAVPGVRSVHVDLQSKRATVEHDGADLAKLCAAVAEEGYQAKPVN